MILKECLKKVNLKDIQKEFKERYQAYDNKTIERIVKEMLSIEPEIDESLDLVLVMFSEENCFEEGEFEDTLYAYSKEKNGAFNIGLTPWEECLGMKVSEKSVEEYGIVRFVAECIDNMTEFGSSNEEVVKHMKLLMEMEKDGLFEPQESLLDYEYPRDEDITFVPEFDEEKAKEIDLRNREKINLYV